MDLLHALPIADVEVNLFGACVALLVLALLAAIFQTGMEIGDSRGYRRGFKDGTVRGGEVAAEQLRDELADTYGEAFFPPIIESHPDGRHTVTVGPHHPRK